MGEATVIYFNQGRFPLTVKSVKLLNAHNLALHAAILYEMLHYRHPLAYEAAWSQEGADVPAREWALRQHIPGAVMRPGNGRFPAGAAARGKHSTYQIALALSNIRRGAGWATGVVITYGSGGHKYTETVLTGLAVDSAPGPISTACKAPMQAINRAFAKGL